ncbi:hypothetical protein [Nocardia sp. NPDC057030]|uniref:hypothetical protein n=1 Tax=unclassified Nocardia TaxID=2637762 RepID=UPI0036338C31
MQDLAERGWHRSKALPSGNLRSSEKDRRLSKLAKHGEAFGVELYKLDKVANDYFPAIATDYQKAIFHCNSVENAVENMMRRPQYFGGETLGPVYRAYMHLHLAVVNCLIDTKTNLDDTGVALAKAGRYFADTDRAAAEEMNRRKQEDDAR